MNNIKIANKELTKYFGIEEVEISDNGLYIYLDNLNVLFLKVAKSQETNVWYTLLHNYTNENLIRIFPITTEYLSIVKDILNKCYDVEFNKSIIKYFKEQEEIRLTMKLERDAKIEIAKNILINTYPNGFIYDLDNANCTISKFGRKWTKVNGRKVLVKSVIERMIFDRFSLSTKECNYSACIDKDDELVERVNDEYANPLD